MAIKVQRRVRLNRRGMRQMLQSEDVQQALHRKALAVADQVTATGIRVEGVPGRISLPVKVAVGVGHGRASARVILDHPSGLAVENKHGVLVEGLDAARGVS